MSSEATVHLGEDPIELDEWLTFCKRHKIVYSPNTVGQNVFYCGDIEIYFGRGYGKVDEVNGRPDWSTARPPAKADEIRLRTSWGDRNELARLAVHVWFEFDGQLSADEEVMIRLVRPDFVPVVTQ